MPALIIGLLLWITMVVFILGGWATHIVTCIQTEAWGFLIAGAIFVPVGIIHGIGIWFGAW